MIIGTKSVEINIPIGLNKKLILVQVHTKAARINNSSDQNINLEFFNRFNI